MGLTKGMAIWGAVVSTIAIVWNIVRDLWIDKGRLSVFIEIYKTIPNHANINHVVINIVNIGKRPILIKGWGIKKGKQIYIILPHPENLPKMLKEGEDITEFTDDLSIIISNDLTEVFVYDSAGKNWYAKKKNIKQLIKHAKKLGLL